MSRFVPRQGAKHRAAALRRRTRAIPLDGALEKLDGEEVITSLMNDAARLMVRGPVAVSLRRPAVKVQLERMDVSSEGETRRYAASTSCSSPLRAR